VQGVLDRALQGEETANFEFPLITKSDRRVEVLLNATTRRDGAGNILGVVGIGQDITMRKAAEIKLSEVAQDLTTLIDTANAPIFGIDALGRVTEWNKKASEITEFRSAEGLFFIIFFFFRFIFLYRLYLIQFFVQYYHHISYLVYRIPCEYQNIY
jgi:PAS domain-containing protein